MCSLIFIQAKVHRETDYLYVNYNMVLFMTLVVNCCVFEVFVQYYVLFEKRAGPLNLSAKTNGTKRSVPKCTQLSMRAFDSSKIWSRKF